MRARICRLASSPALQDPLCYRSSDGGRHTCMCASYIWPTRGKASVVRIQRKTVQSPECAYLLTRTGTASSSSPAVALQSRVGEVLWPWWSVALRGVLVLVQVRVLKRVPMTTGAEDMSKIKIESTPPPQGKRQGDRWEMEAKQMRTVRAASPIGKRMGERVDSEWPTSPAARVGANRQSVARATVNSEACAVSRCCAHNCTIVLR